MNREGEAKTCQIVVRLLGWKVFLWTWSRCDLWHYGPCFKTGLKKYFIDDKCVVINEYNDNEWTLKIMTLLGSGL